MSTTDFTRPPRLAMGSHPKSKTFLCAMNVLSWENGDKVITDHPSCTPYPLADMVVVVNDTACDHMTKETDPDTGQEVRVLCPPCSLGVLNVAHRTAGLPGGTLAQGWAWVTKLLAMSLEDKNLRPNEVALVQEAVKVASGRIGASPHTFHGSSRPMGQLAMMVLSSAQPQRFIVHEALGLPFPKDDTEWTVVSPALSFSNVTAPFVWSAHEVFSMAGRLFVSSRRGRDQIGNAHRAIDAWIAATKPTTEPVKRELAAA